MNWIQTVSSRMFDVVNPDVSMVDIDDIAHSLSMLCRFNGHGTQFYSVAEHSVHVSHEIDPDMALAGLLHDAAEAYLGDVPSPLKKQLPEFKAFEDRVEVVIGQAFGIDAELFKCVELKRADIQVLVDEKEVLMAPSPSPWPAGAPAPKNPERIMAWNPQKSCDEFLKRFQQLTN